MKIPASKLRRRTRRSFITWGIGAVAGIVGWNWLSGAETEDDEIPWPLRKVLRLNEKVWRTYFKSDRAGHMPAREFTEKKPRVNGDIGLDPEWEWELEIGDRKLTMKEIQSLPRTETSAVFKCIEGWSEPISYAGVRFSEFLATYHLGRRADGISWIPYVGLETPDAEYYVSLDIESLLHPHTLLAYEMNGKPLAPANGAPLRLIVPVKYGIKSLKRVGKIFFAEERPPDYWAERGYDWYAGL